MFADTIYINHSQYAFLPYFNTKWLSVKVKKTSVFILFSSSMFPADALEH